MRSKKIFFILPTNKSGGAERVFASLVNYFSSRGYYVSLINFDSDSNFYDIDSRVSVVKLKCDKYKKNKIMKLISLAKGIKSYVIAKKPDMVIGVIGVTEIISALICLSLDIPFFTSVRNSAHSYGKLYRCIRNYYMSRIAGVIFQSNEVMNHKSFSRVKNKIVIPNMLSEQYIINEKFFISKERTKRIINVARLEPQKNQMMLIKAFSLIQANNPEFTLHIYGDGSMKKKLESLIKELNLEHKVFLEGVQHDAILINYNAALFILSSNYEGYPNVLIEAMACGIPCISTDFDSGIAKDLLERRDCGKIIKVGDINELSKTIDFLLNNPQFAEKMAKKGLYVRKELSLSNIGYKWEKFIEDSIKNESKI